MLRRAVQDPERRDRRAPAPFLVGANLPWIRYGLDFGANAWQPGGGLAARGEANDIERQLRALRNAGVEAVRWFVLCDGRAGVQFADDGMPVGLDGAIEQDLDVAFAAAARAGVQVVPVLLDFHWARRARVTRGVRLGGHRRTLRVAARREALLSRVIAPLLARYGRHDSVLAWDVINEPEWITWRYGTWDPTAVRAGELRAFIRAAAGLVHAHTTHGVTVGSASARWLDLVRGLGLDIYQPHWYDRLERHAPLARSVAALALDRPAWLGEFPTRGSRRRPAAVWETARAAGYAGAWFWSVRAQDRHSDPAAALGPLAASNTGDNGPVDRSPARLQRDAAAPLAQTPPVSGGQRG